MKNGSNDLKDLPGTEKPMLLSNAGQSILEDSRSQIKTSALVVLRSCREERCTRRHFAE